MISSVLSLTIFLAVGKVMPSLAAKFLACCVSIAVGDPPTPLSAWRPNLSATVMATAAPIAIEADLFSLGPSISFQF